MGKHAARQTVTTRVAGLEEAFRGVNQRIDGIEERFDGFEAGQSEILALLKAKDSAKAAPKAAPKAKAEKETPAFVTERAARKAKGERHPVAVWLESKNLPRSGACWKAAVAGERRVTVLRKLAA